ncbi:MAG: ABC transporter ATP-binding protein [Desulfovibrionaceae bacterium]
MTTTPTTQAWDIRLENLRVGYDDHVVLDNVSADIPAGQITVILGGSGHGKSTLLRHILGLNRPRSGTVRMGGRDFFALSGREFRTIRRRIGVLFQDGALLGSLTLAQNVGLPLREHTNLRKADIEKVVRHKLSLVGLDEFMDYFPNQLSGGMRKRAGLARAIVMDPPVLFCDEPTSGLDPINAALMDELLLDMKRLLGVTIVVVSHDLESLDTIADHVLVVGEGRLLFQGDLATLKATEEPFLRRFLDRQPGERPSATMAEEDPAVRNAIQRGLGR